MKTQQGAKQAVKANTEVKNNKNVPKTPELQIDKFILKMF